MTSAKDDDHLGRRSLTARWGARVRLSFACVAVAVMAVTGAAAADSCNPNLNKPHPPFRIYGNTYYVGTAGVASVLVASKQGSILIDGDLAASVPQIAANVRALGFSTHDIKLILNSHVHCDHAGGIAALQQMTGAAVAASPSSAAVLRRGGVGPDDPQRAIAVPIAAVANVRTLTDGETVRVGSLALTAHFTPGHTSGGTSWTWISCEKARCLHIVYADSLSVISAPGFRFSDSAAYPGAVSDFRRSFAVLRALPCDILVTVHPEFAGLWRKLKARSEGNPDVLIDPAACRHYAEAAEKSLTKRLAQERSQ